MTDADLELCRSARRDLIEGRNFRAASFNVSEDLAGADFSDCDFGCEVFALFHGDSPLRLFAISGRDGVLPSLRMRRHDLTVLFADAKTDAEMQAVVAKCESSLRRGMRQENVRENAEFSRRLKVAVSNELLHNRNIEACKNVIASFENHFRGSKIRVFFAGDEVKNIDSLFLRQKVIHGETLEFEVASPDALKLSPLKKALEKAASFDCDIFSDISACDALW